MSGQTSMSSISAGKILSLQSVFLCLSHPPLLGREEWTKFEIQMLSPTSSSSWPELCLLLLLNHEPCVLLCSLSCSFWQFRSKTGQNNCRYSFFSLWCLFSCWLDLCSTLLIVQGKDKRECERMIMHFNEVRQRFPFRPFPLELDLGWNSRRS